MLWSDGSCYMGDFYYDKMQGKGIYITALKDIFRGDVFDGYFHGHGEMSVCPNIKFFQSRNSLPSLSVYRIYADTSRYVGEFKNGFRDGKGVFTEKEGGVFFGHFVQDRKHGEVRNELICRQ